MVYTSTGKLFSNKNKALIHVTTWIDLENYAKYKNQYTVSCMFHLKYGGDVSSSGSMLSRFLWSSLPHKSVDGLTQCPKHSATFNPQNQQRSLWSFPLFQNVGSVIYHSLIITLMVVIKFVLLLSSFSEQ